MELLDMLSDGELLDRESADRCDYLRLDRLEPRAMGTTFRVIRTSRTHLDVWHRWTESGSAARRRGLTPRRRTGVTGTPNAPKRSGSKHD